MTSSLSTQERLSALNQIIGRLKSFSKYSAKVIMYTSALGAIIAIGGTEIPIEFKLLIGNAGINLLTNIIDRVARGENIPDEKLQREVEAVIKTSNMSESLTEDYFARALSKIVHEQNKILYTSRGTEYELKQLSTQFADLLERLNIKEQNTEFQAEEVDGSWQQHYKRWLESFLIFNPFPLVPPLVADDKTLIGKNGVYIPCELRSDPIKSLELVDEDFAAIDPFEQSWDAVPRFRRMFRHITFDWVLQHGSPVIIILGSAGSGKTTTLKAEALKILHNSPHCLPVYIECRELLPFLLQNRKVGIWKYLEEYQGLPSNHLFEDRLVKGDVIIFIDGLDEIGGETIEEAVDQLHGAWNLLEYLFKTYNRCKWVISSRYLGISSLHARFANYSCFEICPFEPRDIPLFAEKWFSSPKLKERFVRQVNIPQLNQLATNPLLLTFMALLVQKGWSLPKSRDKLYQRVVDLLISEWDKMRGVERPKNQDLTKELTSKFLEHIAFKIQEKRRRYITRLETIEYLDEFFRPLFLQNFQSESLLVEISTHGIFRETAQNWFGFLHRTFQEYFVALALKDSIDTLIPHRHEVWWREVFTLIGEMVPPKEWYVTLLGQREDAFYSNLLLAGRCLATKRTSLEKIEKRVIKKLASVLNECPYEAVCAEIIEVLAQVNTEETLQILIDFMERTDKPFLKRTVAFQLQTIDWSEFPDTALKLSNGILIRLPNMSPEEDASNHLIQLFGSIAHYSMKRDCDQILRMVRDQDVNQRLQVWLASTTGDIIVECLGNETLKLLIDRRIPKNVRQLITRHLSSVQHLIKEEEILDLLKSPVLEGDVSTDLLFGLKNFQSSSLAKALLELLPQTNKRPTENAKTLIALIIANYSEPSIVSKVENLQHSSSISPQVKESLRYPLWKYGIESLPNLLELLANPSLDHLLKISIAQEIEPIIPPEMLQEVLKYISNEKLNDDVKKILLVVLERYGNSEIAFELMSLLPEKNLGKSVREKIADVIGTLGNPPHVNKLLWYFKQDSINDSVRWRIFIALAKVVRRLPQRGRDALVQEILNQISNLLDSAETANPYIVKSVVFGLGQMGSGLTLNLLRNFFIRGILPQNTFHALKENAQLMGQTIWPEDIERDKIIYQDLPSSL